MDHTHNVSKAFLLELRKGDRVAIQTVYEQTYPLCAAFILNNNGTKEDAKDLFQEALIVLIQKLKIPEFELTANIKTYMYAIVRNLWLKKLRTDSKKGLELIFDEPEMNFQLVGNVDFEYDPKKEEKHEAVETAFSTMGEDCKKIITAFYFQKLSLKEIADWLDYTDNFIKVKKKRCMDALKAKVFGNQPQNK
jgi:RNA polymerase sigma factor (sigma-70 family)